VLARIFECLSRVVVPQFKAAFCIHDCHLAAVPVAFAAKTCAATA
jgi:hypothetical protein